MKSLIIVSILATLVLSVNAQEAPKPANLKVLLVMEQTDFKSALIDKIKTLLEQQQAQITIVKDSEKKIQPFKASDYDLVFITNSGVMSKVRPWITDWLDKNRADSSKILLHTTKKLVWQEAVTVDAVSSASSKKLVPALAQEYVQRLLSKR